MSNKKLVTVFIVVFAIIVLTIYVFVSVRFSTKEKTISKVESNEIKNRIKNINRVEQNKISSKYSSTVYSDEFLNLSYSERDIADERIDFILDLLNNRRIEEIYYILNEDYKNARFPSIDETFKKENSYSSNGYEIDDVSMRINVIDNNTKEKIITISTSKFLNIPPTPKPTSESLATSTPKPTNGLFANLSLNDSSIRPESLNMAFDGFIKTELIDYMYNDDKVSIFGYHVIQYVDGTALVPIIYNKTDEEVTVDFDDSIIIEKIGQNEQNHPLIKNAIVKVPPKSYKICEIKFERTKKIPKDIVYNLKVNDTVINKRISIGIAKEYEY